MRKTLVDAFRSFLPLVVWMTPYALNHKSNIINHKSKLIPQIQIEPYIIRLVDVIEGGFERAEHAIHAIG